jgi:AraC-like DNA-binding protein
MRRPKLSRPARALNRQQQHEPQTGLMKFDPMKQYLLRSAALTKYEEVALSVGINPNQLLHSVGLSPSLLAEQDAWISSERFFALLEESAQAAGIEDFGLRIAETRRLSNLGAIALAVREEPTIREALALYVAHAHLQNEALLMKVKEMKEVATISVSLTTDKINSVRQSIELGVGVLHRLLCELFHGGWTPVHVCFMHSAPVHMAAHRRVFGPTVEFNCDFDGIVCLKRDLDTPILTSDPVFASHMKQYLQSLSERHNAPPVNKVRQLVWKLMPAGRCNVECISQHLGVGRRTLQRHLSESGETFSSIVQSVRIELVLRFMENSNRSLSEIADLLGFQSQSMFSRWFRNNFGCTASAYRAGKRIKKASHAKAGSARI